MYTALQRIALTQAVGFERFKNPVLLLPTPVASRVLLRRPARLRCWRASLGPFVLGCGHHRPLVLVRDSSLLRLGDYDWGQGVVATGVVGGVVVVSGDNYERYVPFYRS